MKTKPIKILDALRRVLEDEDPQRVYTVSDMVMDLLARYPHMARWQRKDAPLVSKVAATLAEMRGFGEVTLVDRASGPRYRRAALKTAPARYSSGVRPSKLEVAYKSLRDEMELPPPAMDRLEAMSMQAN